MKSFINDEPPLEQLDFDLIETNPLQNNPEICAKINAGISSEFRAETFDEKRNILDDIRNDSWHN